MMYKKRSIQEEDMCNKNYKLYSEYNETGVDFNLLYLNQLLEESSKLFNNKIAVRDKVDEITYKELYRKVMEMSNKMVFINQPIAIIVEKTIRTTIQILAVIQSGNYYIPIDPDYPQERREYILKKTNARILLDRDKIIYLHNKEVEIPFSEKLKKGDKIAYIIFTSGSTGKPKGVVETHFQVMNTLLDLKERLNLSKDDNFLSLASFAFDLSVFDIFASVLVGGTLHIEPDQRDFSAVKNSLEKYSITIWNSVPSVMNYFLSEYNLLQTIKNTLRVCLMSGDCVSVELSKKVLQTFPQCEVYSLGGATECSIWSILYLITKKNLTEYTYIPYGYPMTNQKMVIIDEQYNVVAQNEIGQIAILGDGVALGYVGDIQKTNEAFIQHEELGNIYLTGDLGEFTQQGHIRFCGRKDSRIKINGYRVSLNEISSVFHRCFGLENRVFQFKKDEQMEKICLVYHNYESLDHTIIRRELIKHLAIYEMPHIIFNVSKMPLTKNGKVDVEKLKRYVKEKIERKYIQTNINTYEKDSLLKDMLKEVLEVQNISSKDSLFALGIDSLKLVKIKNWINEKNKINIELLDLYDCNNIREIETLIQEKILNKK